ncbi:hypothetical protein TAMC210_22160 [Thermanaeromonas sp. C210]|nr:hypothetical protein TAMC210_22160 [Thermanaeromonas sp. C210]
MVVSGKFTYDEEQKLGIRPQGWLTMLAIVNSVALVA